MKPAVRSLAAAVALYAGAACAMTDTQLAHTLEQRLRGDRTGACVAAAVIDHGVVARARVCADPRQASRIDAHSAFEIGSVSKTMTAALLAEQIEQGKASLDDPLAAWLPAGTAVPSYDGKPILLRHVVTHTSGLPALPSRMRPSQPGDPYAALDEATVLASLADVKLDAAPGTRFSYSNFAMMLLSDALARRAGQDFETLLRTRLFEPLGMRNAYVSTPPQGVHAAAGHLPGGKVTAAWNFPLNLAGVGGVRATLDDMVRYVQAQLGQLHTPGDAALKLTRQPVATASKQPIGINWMLAAIGDHNFVLHEGATGGFSSFVGFDPVGQRGVVLLSDTALSSTGGLGQGLGMHLLDPSLPLGTPRTAATAPASLVDALAGTYAFAGGMQLTLRHRESGLTVQAARQPEFAMDYDSEGDFHPRDFDALLQPQREADGRYSLTWLQGGGMQNARRVDAASGKPQLHQPDAKQLEAFVGNYALTPAFVLHVTREGRQLFAQATGQPRLPLDAVDNDLFAVHGVPARLAFERKDGRVTALTLIQNGLRQRAEKQ
jgi:serine-type D-Ala-D-Ala carboxypeptidase/endopeptidase